MIIALAALLEEEVAAILRDCLWLAALLSYLSKEDPITQNSCLRINIQFVLVHA